MKEFCCQVMNKYARRGNIISYDSSTREFNLILPEEEQSLYGTQHKISYCFWCGSKMPLDLNVKWMEVLEEEYGINDPSFDEKDKVPPEFWTDEWWKKRGL